MVPGGTQSSNVGAELHLGALKDSFKQAANSLTQLYKQSSHSYNVAYQQGKLDAYEEIFAWLMTSNGETGSAQQPSSDQLQFGQSDYKYVPVTKFRKFMQDKLQTQEHDFQKARDQYTEL